MARYMRSKTCRKLYKTDGFTLSEMLMTVVLIGLITAAIAGGIVTARNVYHRISRKADAQTLLGTAVSALTEDLSSATSYEVVTGSSGNDTNPENGRAAAATGTFYSKSRGYRLYYTNGTARNSGKKGIQVVPSGSSGGSVPLLPDKVQTDNLYVYLTDFDDENAEPGSNEDHGYFTLEIEVRDAGEQDADGNDIVIEKATFCVSNQIRNEGEE